MSLEEAREAAKWSGKGVEASGYINDTAFLRRMEEAGFEPSRYANVKQNRSSIIDALTTRGFRIQDKQKHFGSDGKLVPDNDPLGLQIGFWTPYFMVSSDPDFANAKAEYERKGRVSSASNVLMLEKLGGMHVRSVGP